MSRKRKNDISKYFESFNLRSPEECHLIFEDVDETMHSNFDEGEFLAWVGDGGESVKRIKDLSAKELESFSKAVLEQTSTRKVEENFYVISSTDVTAIIKKITTENGECMEPSLYRNIHPQEEFGVGRLIADQVFHLGSLLNSAEIKQYSEKDYAIYASKTLSEDKRLSFVHRFTAGDPESAIKIASHLKQQLNGIMRKIWLASWKLGNEKKKMEFGVSIPQLMRACNPERKSNFGESELENFFQTLKSMEPAQFVLEKKIGIKTRHGRTVEESIKYHISLLRVVAEKGVMNGTPDSVFIHLFDVTPFPKKGERTTYVGMPVRRTTLGMNAKVLSLALWLQIRINQLKGGGKKEKNIKCYDFQRAALIEGACLQPTDAANPRVANARLLKRLAECKEAGIISKVPERIGDVVRLHWH